MKRLRRLISRVYRSDYYPKKHSVHESGIHANLNFQVIADKQTRKLTLLMFTIMVYALSVSIGLWRVSLFHDPVMSDAAIEGYRELMHEVEKFGHIQTEELMEKNTETYWWVYYIRYLVVRLLISTVLISILFFLIKIYIRIRKDRALNLSKEEALSTLHYIARGEWVYQYDENGKTIIDNQTQAPKLLQGFEQNTEVFKLTTKELLDKIPIFELFKSSDEITKDGKDETHHEQVVYELIELVKAMRRNQ